MNKKICGIIVGFIALMLISGNCSAFDSISFNEDNLYSAVKEQIGNYLVDYDDKEKKLIIEDISLINNLEINNKDIKDISGLENFIYLNTLNISNNNISNISILSKLKNLTVLKMEGCNIGNISYLNELVNLEELYLANNELSDSGKIEEQSIITQISNLKNLKILDISHNYLKYTAALANLDNLENLNLYKNSIVDLNGLEQLVKLKVLNLGSNRNGSSIIDFKNLDKLGNLKELISLDFSENYTSNIIKHINNLVNLETLSLEGNSINELSDDILNFKKLKYINLYANDLMDISKLVNLTSIQELILGQNNIEDISCFMSKGILVFNDLKLLDISCNNLNGECNHDVLKYLSEMSENQYIQFDYEYIYKFTKDINSLIHTDKFGTTYVLYDEFGARCNGEYDDFIAIRNAHLFANLNNCEVRASSDKTYHIYKYYADAVDINTNTDWCNANFIIHDEDIEEKSGRYKSLFKVTNMDIKNIVKISNPSWTVNTQTKNIESIKDYLEILNLQGYKKYYCIIQNSNVRQYKRYNSANSSSPGNIQQDYVLVDNEANVLNDIQWDFENITSFIIYPILDNNLDIKNGNFITNIIRRQSDHELKAVYYSRNIVINYASNIVISNINHSVNKDELSGQYAGFIFVNAGTDIQILNCNMYTHKYLICSTYDIKLQKCINVYLDNVKSKNIQDDGRWGIIATHYCKDIQFKNCTLNRIDAHEGIYNLDVIDCVIGIKGLTLTGQGTLNIYNTSVTSNSFITLRQDYGSTWNGNVNIINCTYNYTGINYPKIITATLSYDNNSEGKKVIHDFGYECKFPNVNIQNIIFNMEENNLYSKVCVIALNNLVSLGNYIEAAIEYLPKYSPNTVYVNGCEFINNHKNAKLIISTSNFKQYLQQGNYMIEDTKFTVDNQNDITTQFLDKEQIIYNKTIYYRIRYLSSCLNTVSLYRDEVCLLENIEIKEDYYGEISEPGRYKLIVSSEDSLLNYKGENTYLFNIIGKQAEKITVLKLPAKLQYKKDIDVLDLSGGEVMIHYNDDTYEIINMSDDKLEFIGFDNTACGTQSILVKYNDLNTSFDINVIDNQKEQEQEQEDEKEEEEEIKIEQKQEQEQEDEKEEEEEIKIEQKLEQEQEDEKEEEEEIKIEQKLEKEQQEYENTSIKSNLATTLLPKTGIKRCFTFIIILSFVSMIIYYIKYKKFNM